MTIDAVAPDVTDVAPVAGEERSFTRLWPVLIAIGVGLLIGAALLGTAGANPLLAYKDMLTGTLGSRSDFGLVLVEVVPLVIIALGLSLAFRAKVWNIGAEGQLVMGALVGGWFAIEAPIDAAVPLVLCTFVAGMIGGGAWGAIVGFLKAQWKVNEVISSLLLNYIAVFILGYMVRKPLRASGGFQPVSERLPDAARLPEVPGGFPVHMGLFVALGLVPILMYVLSRTPFGFHIRMTGMNVEAAEAAGVSSRKMYVKLMVLSGAFAGLAGVIQVMGPETRSHDEHHRGGTRVHGDHRRPDRADEPVWRAARGDLHRHADAGRRRDPAHPGGAAHADARAPGGVRVVAARRRASEQALMDWGAVLGLSALIPLLNAGIRLALPTGIAAVGETLCQRAGVLNLSLEGMMVCGALGAFLGTHYSGSTWLGVLTGIVGGLVIAVLMGAFTIVRKTDQVITGIVLVILAQGGTSLIYQELFGVTTPARFDPMDRWKVPLLGEIPGVGSVLFYQSPFFYLAVVVVVGATWLLYRTRLGLGIRAVGDRPAAADAAGLSVNTIRWIAILISGTLAGLAGAVLVVGQLGFFTETVIAGRGWVAIALVIFGRWSPLRVTVGALLFGVTDALNLRIQAAGGGIESGPVRVLPGAPVPGHTDRGRRRDGAPVDDAQPEALGVPYLKGADAQV